MYKNIVCFCICILVFWECYAATTDYVTINFKETSVIIATKNEQNTDVEKRGEKKILNKVLKNPEINDYYGFTNILARYENTVYYKFMSQYAQIWGRGVVSYTRIGEPKYKDLADEQRKCTIKIKGKIQFKGNPNPEYRIKNLGMSQVTYSEGDKIKIRFTVTKHSYVHILGVDENQNIYLLYPNKHTKSNVLKRGTILTFPQPVGNKTEEFELKASLPKGKSETVKMLHIIATKNQPLFTAKKSKKVKLKGYQMVSGSELRDVSKKLAELDRLDWTMSPLPYKIIKK